MDVPLKPLLTTRQKILLLLWLSVPVFYLGYWAVVLPAGPTGRGRLPWWLLMYLPVAFWQVLNDLRWMRRNNPAFVRLIDNRNYQKLTVLLIGFLNAMYCYFIYAGVHSDASEDSRWAPALLGLAMLLLGNYLLPLSQRQYMELEITFDTPFMRRYGDLLVRAYRLAAWLLVLSGAISLAGALWLPVPVALNVAVAGILLVVLAAFGGFWLWVARRRWVLVD